MRRKHYGTTPINGEEGTLNNERSNSNCTLLSSKVYPLSTIQSSSEATMHIQASRPHLSHNAFSLMGSTTTLNAGPAKGMPSTDAVGEAGKPSFTHDFRSIRSTPPALCSRPRSPHQCLMDWYRISCLASFSSRAARLRWARVPGAICGVCRSPDCSIVAIALTLLSSSTSVVASLRLRLRLRLERAAVGALIAYKVSTRWPITMIGYRQAKGYRWKRLCICYTKKRFEPKWLQMTRPGTTMSKCVMVSFYLLHL